MSDIEKRVSDLERRMNEMESHTLPIQPRRLGPQPVTKEQEEADRAKVRKIFGDALANIRNRTLPPPVDRSKQELVSGAPRPDDDSHTKLKENGQQIDYVILSAEERAKGFVRPVRRSYVHTGKKRNVNIGTGGMGLEHRNAGCGTQTTMSMAIAETYARDPKFYGGTFCVGCGKHLPVDEFVWAGTTEQVGS